MNSTCGEHPLPAFSHGYLHNGVGDVDVGDSDQDKWRQHDKQSGNEHQMLEYVGI